MKLRDFLQSRERELTAELDQIYAKLRPLEQELAEIRRAKAALGLSSVGSLSLSSLGSFDLEGIAKISGSGAMLFGKTLAEISNRQPQFMKSLQALETFRLPKAPVLTGETVLQGTGSTIADASVVPSPYQNLTMKQLVVKALAEHFPTGATTRQLLEFFRDAWGRDIERTNLSPQKPLCTDYRVPICRVHDSIRQAALHFCSLGTTSV